LLQVISEALPPDYEVEEVYNAKVPILKFKCKFNDRMVCGDISCSNALALHNSKLLEIYSMFDERVPVLGILIKKWARMFGINDSYARTLSSYGEF
jgi:DNA polymerase sigma